AEPRHHNFDLNLEEGLLTLIGEAPDAELKAAWIAKLPGKSVQDEIRVSDAPAFPAWPDAAEFSAQTVPSLLTGRIRWRNGVLSVDGTVADSDTLARLRRRFDALPPPLRGTFNVAQLEQIDACNAEFADVLKNSTITFETAKAKLVADAKPVLEAVATIANRCPGKLRIEGHTDATGDPEFNRSLSQARAEAVLDALIDLGLDGERVTAEGFGSSRPVAENSIAAGRAQNRRIEISLERVLTPGGNP
ncbi:MAG: OmpA family protein, partial [Myxococcota bacterium]